MKCSVCQNGKLPLSETQRPDCCFERSCIGTEFFMKFILILRLGKKISSIICEKKAYAKSCQVYVHSL